MSDSALKALYRNQIPSAARADALLGLILDLEGHTTLSSLDPAVNPDAAFARDRIFTNARLIRQRLANADPLLLSEYGLASLVGATNALHVELNHFAANGNLAHLVNARAALDNSVYPAMWSIFPETGSGPLDAAQIEAIRTVAERASQAVQQVTATQTAALNAFKDQSVQALDQLKGSQVEILKGLLDQSSSLLKRLTETSTLVDELTLKVAKQSSENAAAIANLEKDYSVSERARAEQFTALLDQQKEDYAQRSKSADAEAVELLVRLHEQEGRVLKLVEAIGTKGITSNYGAIAQREISAANFWRWLTIVIFAVGMSVAFYIFWLFLKAGVVTANLGEIALRFGFALAITAPAIYTARESARHRTIGDRARQSEMELASLGPFIANLERDSQDSIRRDLVAKYFGQRQEAHTAEPPVKFKDVSDLAVELVKATRDASEKKK